MQVYVFQDKCQQAKKISVSLLKRIFSLTKQRYLTSSKSASTTLSSFFGCSPEAAPVSAPCAAP